MVSMFLTCSKLLPHRYGKRLFEEGKLNQAQSHFWKTKPAEELYDLQKDPDEVMNLAKSQRTCCYS